MRPIIFIFIILFALKSVAQVRPDKPEANSEVNLRIKIPAAGESLPDSLMVYRANCDFVKLSSLFRKKYTVIVTGCLTCPLFGRSYSGIDALYLDYFSKVKFYYLYKTLAHPEINGYIQPITIAERLMHITEAEEKLQTRVPWLIDPMTNEVSDAFGLGANSVFMFDNSGKIVYSNYYSDIEELRSKLVELAGPLNRPPVGISIHSAKNQEIFNRSEYKSIRGSIKDQLVPIITVAVDTDSIHYVKLRAEVNQNLLNENSGTMYLGFHLDPIHHVHWNNLVDPLKYSLLLPKGVRIKDSLGIAYRDSSASDRNPREFLLQVDNWGSTDTLPVQVVYYACDEKDRWCRVVVQKYHLILKVDPFAGNLRVERDIDPDKIFKRFWEYDSNRDGILTRDEFPDRVIIRFDSMDANKDGVITEQEIVDRISKIR